MKYEILVVRKSEIKLRIDPAFIINGEPDAQEVYDLLRRKFDVYDGWDVIVLVDGKPTGFDHDWERSSAHICARHDCSYIGRIWFEGKWYCGRNHLPSTFGGVEQW